jgi:hypothetical protein
VNDPSRHEIIDPRRARATIILARAELFAGLTLLGFANGIVGRVTTAILDEGPTAALANTFNVSAVVWVAFIASPALLLRESREPLRRADLIVAAFVLTAAMLPFDAFSWVALSGLALYLLRDPSASSGKRIRRPAYRGAWIILATTGPMLWGRLLLSCASGPILGADAILIGWLTGMDAVGNTVRFAGTGDYILILPPCSSLANVSLAMLCWVLFTQLRGLRWSLRHAGWCLLACIAVIAINVSRIGLAVLHHEQFDLIHGQLGATMANWLTSAAVLGVCSWGTKHVRFGPI